MTPSWLKEKTKVTACSCCLPSRGKTFLSRTLADIKSFLVATVLQEVDANKQGLMQSFAPVFKLIFLILTLILLSFKQSFAFVLLVYSLTLTLVLLSRLKLNSFLKQTLMPAFFFAFLLILPAALITFSDGKPLFTVWHLKAPLALGPLSLPTKLALTYSGLSYLLFFFLRALTMISVTILVLRTTKIPELINGLALLRLPAVFILLLQMAYRFIFILVQTVENLFLAKKSRSLKLGSTKTEQSWSGRQIGFTLNKAVALSDEVTLAMIARGWQGKVYAPELKIKAYDLIAFFAFLIFIVSAFWLGSII